VINFNTEKKPNIKFFDFEAFQKILEMLSREKIIFHMLFGAFNDNPHYFPFLTAAFFFVFSHTAYVSLKDKRVILGFFFHREFDRK